MMQKNDEFKEFKRTEVLGKKDKYGQLVFLADSDFTIK
jgi:peptide chain release factor 3